MIRADAALPVFFSSIITFQLLCGKYFLETPVIIAMFKFPVIDFP
jgi:hypothetical protein